MTEAMPYREVIEKGRRLLDANNITVDAADHLLAFAEAVVDLCKEKPKIWLRQPWVKPFLLGLKHLEDDFTVIVEADPMVLYKPAHEVALAFHRSQAKIRYNCSANRTSKSQTGYAEHYFYSTRHHPFRTIASGPSATFLIGVDFSKYAPKVFEAKFISGEVGNILSPMFPEGGKWLNHYDSRKHIITLACPECAEANKASFCKHQKSTITLFSDNEGIEVLMGGQYGLGHFDEHISVAFL